MGRTFRVDVRIVADSQEEADLARAFLLRALPGLTLRKGRAGRNPKYADNPRILAYGDLDVEVDGLTVRRRRRRS